MNSKPLFSLALGTALGFTVGRLGFADFGQLHQMLLFRDLRLFLAFCLAAGLSIALFAALRGALPRSPDCFERGTIPGAVLFGIGWAITGACPGVVLVQLGQGIPAAGVTLVGVLIGIFLQSRFTKPAPENQGSC
jgi:uncharacterized membrane protein YedE/YeeE